MNISILLDGKQNLKILHISILLRKVRVSHHQVSEIHVSGIKRQCRENIETDIREKSVITLRLLL